MFTSLASQVVTYTRLCLYGYSTHQKLVLIGTLETRSNHPKDFGCQELIISHQDSNGEPN